MGIESYKISSDQHVWNAVYLNHRWYHLDLTWDDPVTDTGENVLEHKFFLVDTPTLLSLEQTEHRFDQNIYSELKRLSRPLFLCFDKLYLWFLENWKNLLHTNLFEIDD